MILKDFQPVLIRRDLFPPASKKSIAGANQAADKMAELWDPVYFKAWGQFIANEKQRNDDKGQGNLFWFDIWKRTQQNQHECDAASPDQGIWEDKGI